MTGSTRYQLTGRVATSATATVWKALDGVLDRVVAIKALHPELAGRPELRERLRHEAQVLAAITDPHIVAVYDFVEREDEVWLVEEWVEGATLRRVRDSAGRLTPEQAVGVVRGALIGLAAVHGSGVVHRDVAPTNILVSTAGESKLVDFGLAAPVGGAGAAGTPAYMSPEAVRGTPLSPASDVYSVAAVLSSLLTGTDVFAGEDVERVLARHLDPSRPPLTEVSPGLREVLAGSLVLDPAGRPQDAAALLRLLEEAARRDLGADWLSRAGVAALVTTALGTAGLGGARKVVRHPGASRRLLGGLSVKAVTAVVAVLAVAGAVTGIAVSKASGKHHQAATAAPATTTSAVSIPSPDTTATAAGSSTAPTVATSAPVVLPAVNVAGSASSSTASAASGFVTKTGKLTYELGTIKNGFSAGVCLELQTAGERFHVTITEVTGYQFLTSHKASGLDLTMTGIQAKNADDSKPPRWPIGSTVSVSGNLNDTSTGFWGCPPHRELYGYKVG